MKEQKLRQTRILFLLIWVLILALLVISGTFAWFTFNSSTNIEPMASTISSSGASLMISNSPDGPFEETCQLILNKPVEAMEPVSTSNMEKFYAMTAQTSGGIAIRYIDVTDEIDSRVMHGKVYLKSLDSGCDVYLHRSGLFFGTDAQALASMRLGLKVTAGGTTTTFIFNLDEMGGGGAASTRTVPSANTVVSGLTGDKNASYSSDPSIALSTCSAVESGADDKEPGAGQTKLCALAQDEVGTVEYWLYLEGCDDNCINEVQSKDVALELAFAGVSID